MVFTKIAEMQADQLKLLATCAMVDLQGNRNAEHVDPLMVVGVIIVLVFGSIALVSFL